MYTTLNFICWHANQFQLTPVITFDKPFWKALEVIQGQPEDSRLQSIVLTLGGFHTEMSTVGSI